MPVGAVTTRCLTPTRPRLYYLQAMIECYRLCVVRWIVEMGLTSACVAVMPALLRVDFWIITGPHYDKDDIITTALGHDIFVKRA